MRQAITNLLILFAGWLCIYTRQAFSAKAN